MSEAIFIPVQNLLAEAMRAPGGAKIKDALLEAQKNLESVREPCLDSVDQQMIELDRLCKEGGAQPDDTVKLGIYVISNDVHAVAGVFGLKALSEAAFSLCELVDQFRSLELWNQQAVAVHVTSFALLRHPETAPDAAAVLAGLRQLSSQAAAIAR